MSQYHVYFKLFLELFFGAIKRIKERKFRDFANIMNSFEIEYQYLKDKNENMDELENYVNYIFNDI